VSTPSLLTAGPRPAPAVPADLRGMGRLTALAPAFRAAADAYGTPQYVTDLETLDHCAAEVESAFPEPWLRQYSLKANGLPAVVRRLARRGWGGNVVSAGEWRLARRAGLPNAETSFEGIGKTDQELRTVVRAALDDQPLRWLSVESSGLQVLRRLSRNLQAGWHGRPPVGVLVRLNPQVEPETAAGLAVGRMSSKFGLTADEVRQLSLAGAFDDPASARRPRPRGLPAGRRPGVDGRGPGRPGDLGAAAGTVGGSRRYGRLRRRLPVGHGGGAEPGRLPQGAG
jgi:hypothetical protein